MAAPKRDVQWLVDLHQEHGAELHRLAVLLGAGASAEYIVHSALVSLGRSANRVVDPAEQLEYVQELVVHDARAVRGSAGTLHLPDVDAPRQQEILNAINRLPLRYAEPLVISHFLSAFGPVLSGILRMTLRASNARLEESLNRLRAAVGDPTPRSMPGTIESLSQEVAAALRAAGRRIPPAADESVEEDLRVLDDENSRGVPVWLVVPLVVISALLGSWVAAATAPQATAGPEPTPTSTPTAEPTSSPTAISSRSLPAQVRSVPVYYVGRQDGKLYRELRDLPATGNLAQAAIEAILSLAPLDPDYDSPWGPGKLLGVELSGHTLTVNLSAEAYETITSPQIARSAANQVVYTSSELMGDPQLRVQFLSDGGPPPKILAQPQDGFARTGLDPMPALWLLSPKNAAVVPAGSIVVTGTVKAAAEAPVVTISDEDGQVVTSTSAQTATSANKDGWRVWTVQVTLRRGTYSIVATTRTADNSWVSENKIITVQ